MSGKDVGEASIDPLIDDIARRVIFLDELKEMGATFGYPTALDSSEWVGLVALGRARARLKIEEHKNNSDNDGIKASMQSHRANLVAKAKGH